MKLNIYCLACRKNTNNFEKVTMTNEVIKRKSRCTICSIKKSRFLRQNHNKKGGW